MVYCWEIYILSTYLINCASPAYLGYKLGLSYSAHGNVLAEIHLSGENVALKNHLKEFSRNIVAPMYHVLKNSVVSFVTENKFPFGVLAYKLFVKHLK